MFVYVMRYSKLLLAPTEELKGNANSEFTISIQSTAQFVIKRKRYLYLDACMYMINLMNKIMNI